MDKKNKSFREQGQEEQLKGTVKKKVGEFLGEEDIENAGDRERRKGKLKEGLSNLKDAVTPDGK
ncbi:MAG: CsbD family protein [Myxococcota bacterium]